MTDAPYTKREIDTLALSLNKRFDDQDFVLKEIKTQTLKTNGRVNKLELYVMLGGAVIITIIALKYPDLVAILHKFI